MWTRERKTDALDMAQVRMWIHAGRKLALHYADEQGRDDFRTFRTDRVVSAEFLEERYPGRPAVLRARWTAKMEADRAAWIAAGKPDPHG